MQAGEVVQHMGGCGVVRPERVLKDRAGPQQRGLGLFELSLVLQNPGEVGQPIADALMGGRHQGLSKLDRAAMQGDGVVIPALVLGEDRKRVEPSRFVEGVGLVETLD